MPIRHLCEEFEAGETCTDRLCLHADDGTQYLFETVWQVMAFAMTPDRLKDIFCSLMDLGFDENNPQD